MTFAKQESQISHDVVYHLLLLSLLPGKKPTAETLTQHAAHLAQLDRQGLLVMAGPFPGRFGGLIVLRTTSVDEARRIAEVDPMIVGGFQSYDVIPWAQATSRNNYQPNAGPGVSK